MITVQVSPNFTIEMDEKQARATYEALGEALKTPEPEPVIKTLTVTDNNDDEMTFNYDEEYPDEIEFDFVERINQVTIETATQIRDFLTSIIRDDHTAIEQQSIVKNQFLAIDPSGERLVANLLSSAIVIKTDFNGVETGIWLDFKQVRSLQEWLDKCLPKATPEPERLPSTLEVQDFSQDNLILAFRPKNSNPVTLNVSCSFEAFDKETCIRIRDWFNQMFPQTPGVEKSIQQYDSVYTKDENGSNVNMFYYLDRKIKGACIDHTYYSLEGIKQIHSFLAYVINKIEENGTSSSN